MLVQWLIYRMSDCLRKLLGVHTILKIITQNCFTRYQWEGWKFGTLCLFTLTQSPLSLTDFSFAWKLNHASTLIIVLLFQINWPGQKNHVESYTYIILQSCIYTWLDCFLFSMNLVATKRISACCFTLIKDYNTIL